MSNIISSHEQSLMLSNGETAQLIEAVARSASAMARTSWQKDLAVWFAMHDQNVFGGGCVSLDLSELGWTLDTIDEERIFMLSVIDDALQHVSTVSMHLQALRTMVQDAEPADGPRSWSWQGSRPTSHERCTACGVFLHIAGCVCCNAHGPH